MHDDFIYEFDTTASLLKAMLEVLHDSGLRVTNQRKIILEAIAHQVGWHVHPKDIYCYVKEKDDKIGMATIYRTLKMLEDMDLLNKVYKMGKHDLTPNDHGAHYHLVCLKCGNIQDITDVLLDDVRSKISKQYRFKSTQINLSLYGMCSECNIKNPEE